MWRWLMLLAFPLPAFAILSRPLGQDSAIAGAGWTLLRLDLDVTVSDSGQGLQFSGQARLRLDADSSSGPALSLNTRVPALRYTRFSSAQGSSTLNGRVAGDSAVRVARIRFDTPRRKGEVIDVDFAYQADSES